MSKTEKNAGLIAGFSLIVMAIAAGFSYGFVQNKLVHESAKITLQNLAENKNLFLAGLAGWIVIFTTDLIVSGALYLFFRNSRKRISAITAIIRIVYSLLLGFAIFQLFSILPDLTNTEAATKISLQFASFEKIWSIGLIVFGFHLIGLGYLSIKSKFTPNILAYLLYLAGVSYVFIHVSKQFALFNQHIIASTESVLALPMALGEILFAFWLVYIGLKKAKRAPIKSGTA